MRSSPNPKIFSDFRSLPAGPVVANSPAVLAPPIPQWVPSAARAWAPVRHATRSNDETSAAKYFRIGASLVKVVLVGLVLTSCTLTTYPDLPSIHLQSSPLLQKRFTLYYRVDPASYLRQAMNTQRGEFFYHFPARLRDYEELRLAFTASGFFSETVASSAPPAKGLYCSVTVDYRPLSESDAFFLSLSHISATIFPSYNSTSGHLVRFDLYIDGDLKKSYEYAINKRQAVWAGLVPVAWINFFTWDLADAFRATAYQFLVDAALDGYLVPP